MNLALNLAERGIESCLPNPAVGALLVKEGRIIGRGFHKGPGTLHGEAEAISTANEDPSGSTLYTTLEPCCSVYEGKHQPPCTELIVRKGIIRVVLASRDPNWKVNGNGINSLENAGIEVVQGILDEENRKLNEAYFTFHEKKRPFIHLKIAQTLDGKIATANGDSRWITDEPAREEVHRLRSKSGAVLVGSGTVRKDNPLLTARYGLNRRNERIVLSGKGDISPDSRVFSHQDQNPTRLLTGTELSSEQPVQFKKKGVSLKSFQTDSKGKISWNEILTYLHGEGIVSLLVEGGSEVFTSLIKEQLYDRITVYVAPVLCGTGISSIGDLGIEKISDAVSLANVSLRELNGQIVFTGERC